MKEKIITVLTLGSIFSLFFYYKVNSPSDVILSNSANSSSSEEVVQKLMNEIIEENNDNSLSESKEENELSKDVICSKEQDETNKMSFDDAFKYYRACEGSKSSFTWNDNKYTTLLASEIDVNESSIAFNKNKESNIDKHHYDLQKEILGVSQSK